MDNVITALTSDGMIAPSYWIDPKTGNNYMVTVQYFNEKVNSMTMSDFRNIPLRATNSAKYTPLQSVAAIDPINTPTEVDHNQIRRVIDVYVMPKSEDLSGINNEVNGLIKKLSLPKNARVTVSRRGSWHERIIFSVWSWFAAFRHSGLSDSDGAVSLLH